MFELIHSSEIAWPDGPDVVILRKYPNHHPILPYRTIRRCARDKSETRWNRSDSIGMI